MSSYDAIWSVLLLESDYKAVIVGRESGALEKYRLSDVKGKPVLSLKTAHKATITTLALAPNGGDEIYSASLDKSICHWNLTDDLEQLEADNNGKRLVKSTLTTTGIRCGVVVNEMLCCGGSDGGVHALREGVPERWVGHSDVVSCVSQCQTENGDGLLASGSYDGTIRIWNIMNGVTLFNLTGHTSQLKGVQFIDGHLGVMGVGRDDTVRLWLLPEEIDFEGTSGNGEEDGAEGEGEEAAAEEPEYDENGEVIGEGGDDTVAAGGRRGSYNKGLKRTPCSAILGLPAAPLCVAVQLESENPLIAVGLSGGAMATIRANKFLSTVSAYCKINSTEVKRERKRLDTLLKAEEKKELATRKKAIRKKKKELVDEQKKEEADAKNKDRAEKLAARQAERTAARDDDDEEEEEEEMPEEDMGDDEEEYDDEEGEEFTLTEERQTALEEFKTKAKKESDDKMRSLRTSVGDRKRVLEPIGIKKFEREAKQFDDLAFTRFLPKAASESINAVAFNGAQAIVAAGNVLKIVDSTPGVQSL